MEGEGKAEQAAKPGAEPPGSTFLLPVCLQVVQYNHHPCSGKTFSWDCPDPGVGYLPFNQSKHPEYPQCQV